MAAAVVTLVAVVMALAVVAVVAVEAATAVAAAVVVFVFCFAVARLVFFVPFLFARLFARREASWPLHLVMFGRGAVFGVVACVLLSSVECTRSGLAGVAVVVVVCCCFFFPFNLCCKNKGEGQVKTGVQKREKGRRVSRRLPLSLSLPPPPKTKNLSLPKKKKIDRQTRAFVLVLFF